jgi:deoxyribodipyrimidine photolyase-related protein
MTVAIVFPHQLFEESVLMNEAEMIYLVEEYLFFREFNFHRQKLIFHRASMKYYEVYLQKKHKKVVYIDANNPLSDIRLLLPYLKEQGFHSITYIDTTDNWLQKRIQQTALKCQIHLKQWPSPLFLNDLESLEEYFSKTTKMFQTDFYRFQRKKWKILVDANLSPVGGKWSFDAANRLRYPTNQIPPVTNLLPINQYVKEAIDYVQQHYPNNPGSMPFNGFYPVIHSESKHWLRQFLSERFYHFGAYEDAIDVRSNILFHSVLSPMLNNGLLTPQQIVDEFLHSVERQIIPINSQEGFVRQIIGWREFIRAVYELQGTRMRNANFWQHQKNDIPSSFYNGTTGIAPIDFTIRKVLETGYCHHIERLMILGNFMLLCELHPNVVYKWFMELFIDAYDWVMVPNVYGMSQFADGGIMATKPYISGSNYILKMSNYPKGHWQQIWDALFWRFIHKHADYFSTNVRMNMLVQNFNKWPETKRKLYLNIAEKFLSKDLK